jgi:tetratricopeptide (TPR) repeat protein
VPAAERFLYLPLVGGALAAGAAWEALDRRLDARARRLAASAGVLIVLTLATGTALRHAAWHDNGTLWRQTARDFPRSWGARHGLGAQLREDGDLAGAARELEAALRLGPSEAGRASIEVDLGIVYGMEGRLDESLELLKRAVVRRPLAKSYFNLGVTLARLGDRPGATRPCDTIPTTRSHTHSWRSSSWSKASWHRLGSCFRGPFS